jgi:hypothetical protein
MKGCDYDPWCNIIKLFLPRFSNVPNMLEFLSFASLSSIVSCLQVRPLALPLNIKLGWKRLLRISNLAV